MTGKKYYGLDNLSLVLLILSIPLLFGDVSLIFAIIIILYALYRVFSSDIFTRRKELDAFEEFIREIKFKLKNVNFQYIKSIPHKIKDKIKYTIIKCPRCNQKLRLPRKKGNIVVTCKKCSLEFKTKT